MSRGHLSHIEAPNMVSSFSISILFDICEALKIQLKNRFTGSDFRSLRRAVQSSTLKTRKLSGKFDQSFRFCCAANLGRRGYTGDCELQRAFRAQPPSAALSVRWPPAFRPWRATASVAAQPRSGAAALRRSRAPAHGAGQRGAKRLADGGHKSFAPRHYLPPKTTNDLCYNNTSGAAGKVIKCPGLANSIVVLKNNMQNQQSLTLFTSCFTGNFTINT